MRFQQRAWPFIFVFAFMCAPITVQAAHQQPQHASVCQLSRFGATNDGKVYETSAIYATQYRHGAYLMSATGPHCVIQLGTRQGDVDGSVGRFDKALLHTKAKHGLAAARSVTVVLVFHWIKTSPGHELDAFGRPWGARGVVELRRVVNSAYYPSYPNQSSKRTREKPRAA